MYTLIVIIIRLYPHSNLPAKVLNNSNSKPKNQYFLAKVFKLVEVDYYCYINIHIIVNFIKYIILFLTIILRTSLRFLRDV
jgi:hypothetical protein